MKYMVINLKTGSTLIINTRRKNFFEFMQKAKEVFEQGKKRGRTK